MSQFITNLKAALSQDIHDLDALSKLLDQEKSLLKTRKSKEIEALTKQKSALIQQIEARSKMKAKLIAGSGLGIRPGQVEKALTSLNDPELMTLWKDSRDKLTHCKERNLVNGTIINLSLQRTNRLMNIIRGKGSAPNLYGQKGKESSYTGGQRIGKA